MSPEIAEFIRLAPLGFAVGAYGTLVGAGGGSVLVPALLILLPHETPATITAISLAVVFFNAYSGTIAYMRMGRIDYRTATLFTLASLPGAVIGVLLVRGLPRGLFDPLFGTILLVLGAFLVANPLGKVNKELASDATGARPTVSRLGTIGSAYIPVFRACLVLEVGLFTFPF